VLEGAGVRIMRSPGDLRAKSRSASPACSLAQVTVHRENCSSRHRGLRLLDTATGSGSLEGLTILASGTVASAGLGLLDIAPDDDILVSLAILGLGSSSRLGLAPWVKNSVYQ